LEGEIHLIDEIHTPDSSRYFYADGYEERQENGVKQKQLSKEFVRQWLISEGFQGQEGQQVPEMGDDVVKSISNRYLELYEKVIGEPLKKQDYSNIEKRIENNILNGVN
ncbi:MAG: phosphoribosylaminoimidazolesuccinocarboxamide synthase, partial [Bacteroidota bacterium]